MTTQITSSMQNASGLSIFQPENHEEKFGLFKYVPQEVLDQVVQKFPTDSFKKIDECIKQMKVFWQVLDVVKFARWVRDNKIPLYRLNLSLGDLETLLPQLEYLDLRESDFNQFHLLKTCKQLKHLILEKNQLNSLTNSDIKDLQGLKSLDLDWYPLTNLDVDFFLRKHPELEIFKCGFVNLTDEIFKSLITLPKLRSLKVTGPTLTNKRLIDLATNLPWIEELGISASPVTDAGLMTLATELPHLKELEILNCSEIKDEDFAILTKFTELKTLSICASNAKSRDAGLEFLVTKLPKLENLHLMWWNSLTDEGLKILAKKLPKLKVLKISSHSRFTDEGLKALFTNLSELHTLVLTGVQAITDESLEILAVNLKELKTLKLSQCSKITDRGLQALVTGLKELEFLEVNCCPHLTSMYLDQLKIQLPQLRLNYKHCWG